MKKPHLTEDQIQLCEGLDNWMSDINDEVMTASKGHECNPDTKRKIDAILEWLNDSGLLTEEGKDFAHTYYIHTYREYETDKTR